MRYVVIGASGKIGSTIVKDLFETTKKEDEIIVADCNISKVVYICDLLDKLHKKVKPLYVDLLDKEKTIIDISQADIIINASQYEFNLLAMEIALELNCHYIDLGGLFHMTQKQLELNNKFKNIGKIAIIGVGASPGISNILAKLAIDDMTSVNEVHIRVASIDKTKYSIKRTLPKISSLKTILEKISMNAIIFKNSRFKYLEPLSGAEIHRFPFPIGIQKPSYTLHSEIATLPLSFKKKGIKEVTFKIAFNEDFLEKIKFLKDLGLASNIPLDVNGVNVSPIDFINKVNLNQPEPIRIGDFKQYDIIRTIVKGTRKGKKVTWILDCHCSGFSEWEIGTDINKAAPSSIVSQMILNDKLKDKGVFPPEKLIETKSFFEELEKRNIFIKIQKKDGWAFEV